MDTLGYFHMLVFLNSAHVITGVHVSFQISSFVFFKCVSRSRITGSYGVLLLVLWEASILFSLLAATIYSLISSVLLFCCSVLSDSVIPMDCSTPGFPVLHYLPEFGQTHVHWVGDAIQPFHPLLSPSPPVFNLSQPQGLLQWVSSLHLVTTVLELQL